MTFFLASLFGLFPIATVPISLGWKALHPFDVAFGVGLILAIRRGAFRTVDRGLVFAGIAFVGSAALSFAAHPSARNAQGIASLAYSVAVLVLTSHLRLDVLDVDPVRTMLGPLRIATGIACLVFFAEYASGRFIGPWNASGALPPGVFRLGGFTGGNVLALFLGVAAPFFRTAIGSFVGALLPAWLTLSRVMVGVGVAILVRDRIRPTRGDRLVVSLRFVAMATVLVGLAVYAFLASTNRADFHLGMGQGDYVRIHAAALGVFFAHPLLGAGPDGLEASTGGWAAHSALVGLAAENGLAGVVAFGWLVLTIGRRFARSENAELRASTISAGVALLVGGCFVDWFLLKGAWLWLGLMLTAAAPAPIESGAAFDPEGQA